MCKQSTSKYFKCLIMNNETFSIAALELDYAKEVEKIADSLREIVFKRFKKRGQIFALEERGVAVQNSPTPLMAQVWQLEEPWWQSWRIISSLMEV